MRQGFTLLELLVVLVIIGFVSALVGPRLAGHGSNLNLATAARKISACLRYARSHAASEKRRYVATFDFEKNRLTIQTDQKKSKDSVADFVDEDVESAAAFKPYNVPEGVKLEKAYSVDDEEVDSDIFEILFFPSGGSSGGLVVLKNDREKKETIYVDLFTGSVKLGRPEKE